MKKFKVILSLVFIFLVYEFINYLILDIKLVNGNEAFVKKMLQNSNYHLLYEKQEKNYIYKLINLVNGITVKDPITILEKSFAYNYTNDTFFSYITNTVIDNPRVYIYSTHPTELYEGKKLEGYEITPNVILASILLQEKLNKMGINTIIEERSAAEYIKKNNLSYNDSYVATREFLTDTLKKHTNLDLIIDLHRDATKKEITTTTINNRNYARLMFVQNVNIKENYNLAKNISDKIEKKYPGLSRGVFDKQQFKFNQDLSTKAILIEVGGNYNNITEVVNSVDALAVAIGEYLNER